jgi:hypothetical protein
VFIGLSGREEGKSGYVFSPLVNGRGEFWYFVGINARKPAAKPVVLPVVHNIQPKSGS